MGHKGFTITERCIYTYARCKLELSEYMIDVKYQMKEIKEDDMFIFTIAMALIICFIMVLYIIFGVI